MVLKLFCQTCLILILILILIIKNNRIRVRGGEEEEEEKEGEEEEEEEEEYGTIIIINCMNKMGNCTLDVRHICVVTHTLYRIHH